MNSTIGPAMLEEKLMQTTLRYKRASEEGQKDVVTKMKVFLGRGRELGGLGVSSARTRYPFQKAKRDWLFKLLGNASVVHPWILS